MDTNYNEPALLKSYTKTNSIIQNDEGKTFVVYKKRFQKGDSLSFGGAILPEPQEFDFMIMAQPATDIEPPYDLKSLKSYKAIDASWKGPGVVKGQVDGKDRVIFKNASAENVLEWNFSVGVGDMYSLTISYNNPLDKEIKGNLKMFAADGTLMKGEEITFTPTREGKSNYINTTTGTMINAGNYILRLTSKEAEGLSINSLDVQ
jgi:hypothetical protein